MAWPREATVLGAAWGNLLLANSRSHAGDQMRGAERDVGSHLYARGSRRWDEQEPCARLGHTQAHLKYWWGA